MVSLRAYILAGGRSSRFGSDKARAEIDGTPLIARIADAARTEASGVTVVAEVKDKYADLDLRTIADRRPGGGPLAGLETALLDAAEQGGAWIFLASCDLLELKPAWIERLRSQCAAPAEFVAFRGAFWEPLIACYHVSLISRVATHLDENSGAMWKLLDVSHGVGLALPDDWPARVQANTPAELADRRIEL